MAWTKAKTAVVAVTAVILATGTTTVIVKHIATGPALATGTWVDDSFFEANSDKLSSAPPNLLILRPTRSTRVSGPLFISGHKGMAPNTVRMNARCVLFQSVIEMAYDFPQRRMVFSADIPKDKFDFLITMPGDIREALQAEIKKQFNLAGRMETRDMDVLLLKLRTPAAPGLKRGTGELSTSGNYVGGRNNGKYVAENAPISMFAGHLENSLKQIVIDKTGLTGKYNIELDGRVLQSIDTLKDPLLNQLGLELVPAREPVEMLVVEKAK